MARRSPAQRERTQRTRDAKVQSIRAALLGYAQSVFPEQLARIPVDKVGFKGYTLPCTSLSNSYKVAVNYRSQSIPGTAYLRSFSFFPTTDRARELFRRPCALYRSRLQELEEVLDTREVRVSLSATCKFDTKSMDLWSSGSIAGNIRWTCGWVFGEDGVMENGNQVTDQKIQQQQQDAMEDPDSSDEEPEDESVQSNGTVTQQDEENEQNMDIERLTVHLSHQQEKPKALHGLSGRGLLRIAEEQEQIGEENVQSKEHNRQLHDGNVQLKKDYASLKQKYVQLKKDKALLDEEKEEWDNENELFRQGLLFKKTFAENRKDSLRVSTLELDNYNLKEANKELKEDNAKLKNACAERKQVNKSLSEDRMRLYKKNVEPKKEHARLVEDNDAQLTKSKELARRNTTLQVQGDAAIKEGIEQLKKCRAEWDEEKADMNTTIAQLNTENAFVKNAKTLLETEHESLKTTYLALAQHVAEQQMSWSEERKGMKKTEEALRAEIVEHEQLLNKTMSYIEEHEGL